MKDKSPMELFVEPDGSVSFDTGHAYERTSVTELYLQPFQPEAPRGYAVHPSVTLTFVGEPKEEDDFCDDNCPQFCGCDFARRNFPQFYWRS